MRVKEFSLMFYNIEQTKAIGLGMVLVCQTMTKCRYIKWETYIRNGFMRVYEKQNMHSPNYYNTSPNLNLWNPKDDFENINETNLLLWVNIKPSSFIMVFITLITEMLYVKQYNRRKSSYLLTFAFASLRTQSDACVTQTPVAC